MISPGDLQDEREVVQRAITAWNAHTGRVLNARIEAVLWESHARPQMGGPPQAIINEQIVDSCDFGVALFWSRIGTPTTDHDSGSVEEVYRLKERKKHVSVYFCDRHIPQGLLDGDQYTRLQKLKARLHTDGLLWKFGTAEELDGLLSRHLTSVMSGLLSPGSSKSERPLTLAEEIARDTERGRLLETIRSYDAQDALEQLLRMCLANLGFDDDTRIHIIRDRDQSPIAYQGVGVFQVYIGFAPEKVFWFNVLYGHVEGQVVFRCGEAAKITIESLESVASVTEFLEQGIQTVWNRK